jgi:HK97 family phage major capsid protein
MDKIMELRDQMAKLATDARAEYDKITEKTSEAEAKEIEGRFDAMMADHDKLGAQVEREERLAKALASRRPVEDGEGHEVREINPDYKEVFEKQLRFGAGTLSAAERKVLAEHRAQSVGTDSAGGYTVPEGFSNMLEKTMQDWGPMYDGSVVTEMKTASGNEIPWPTIDDTAARGSIKAENAAYDDDGSDDMTFGSKTLNAYVYGSGIVKLSMELLQDSYFNMEQVLSELFGERLGRTANDALTTGTGSSAPNGIVTAAGAGVTADSATAITADELFDMQHSVNAAYRRNPKCGWMFNDQTLLAIRKLKDGQNNYLWQVGDVRTGEPSTLLGKPYYINDSMADIGTGEVPVLFGDFSKYVVRKVNGISVVTLRERYAEYGQVGMVANMRFDGELINTAAIKKLTMA